MLLDYILNYSCYVFAAILVKVERSLKKNCECSSNMLIISTKSAIKAMNGLNCPNTSRFKCKYRTRSWNSQGGRNDISFREKTTLTQSTSVRIKSLHTSMLLSTGRHRPNNMAERLQISFKLDERRICVPGLHIGRIACYCHYYRSLSGYFAGSFGGFKLICQLHSERLTSLVHHDITSAYDYYRGVGLSDVSRLRLAACGLHLN